MVRKVLMWMLLALAAPVACDKETPTAPAAQPKTAAAPQEENPGTPHTKATWNSKQKTLVFAAKLSLAALAHSRGAPDEAVQEAFVTAKNIAGELGLVLPTLPPRSGDGTTDGAAALTYLLDVLAEEVVPALAAAYDDQHVFIFEFALKSSLLRLVYGVEGALGPEPMVVGVLQGYEGAAQAAALPDVICEETHQLVMSGAEFEAVYLSINRMHERALLELGD